MERRKRRFYNKKEILKFSTWYQPRDKHSVEMSNLGCNWTSAMDSQNTCSRQGLCQSRHSKQFGLDFAGWIWNLGNDNQLISHGASNSENNLLISLTVVRLPRLWQAIHTQTLYILSIGLYIYIDIYMCMCLSLQPGLFQKQNIPLCLLWTGSLWCSMAEGHQSSYKVPTICLKILILLTLLRPVETKVGGCSDSLHLLFHFKWLVLFYFMFIVIALSSLCPNSIWLFTRARIFLISKIILFMFALSFLFLPFVWRFSIESPNSLLALHT